jgi:hypothetical protein
MNPITQKAWDVFRASFQDGESVVAEDDVGRFFYGKLQAEEEGITLVRPSKSTFLEWDEIEFIAHDGFPVQPIMGMSAEEAELRASMEPTDIVRAMLEQSIDRPRERKVKTKAVHFGGGCPWFAGPVRLLAIHNRRNSGPKFWCWPYDSLGEVMVFGSGDGAVMHSYDSEHLFLEV